MIVGDCGKGVLADVSSLRSRSSAISSVGGAEPAGLADLQWSPSRSGRGACGSEAHQREGKVAACVREAPQAEVCAGGSRKLA